MKGLTVFDYLNKCWNDEPEKFKTNPVHQFADCVQTQSLSHVDKIVDLAASLCFTPQTKFFYNEELYPNFFRSSDDGLDRSPLPRIP